jgi:hypothetical protein
MTEIVDCPALHARHIHKGYPFGDKVPKTVRLKQTVTTDVIAGAFFLSNPPLVAVNSATYPAWTNSYGAVCAVFPDGDMLGLKPDEFEVVEWH